MNDLRRLSLGSVFAILLVSSPGCTGVAAKNEKADTLADKILILLAAKDGNTFYDQCTAEAYRNAHSREEVRKLITALGMRLGKAEIHTLVGFRIESTNGLTRGEYIYNVTWARDNGRLRLELLWQDGDWKVLAFDVQSEAVRDGVYVRKRPNGKNTLSLAYKTTTNLRKIA
jgi:hypothetical protein